MFYNAIIHFGMLVKILSSALHFIVVVVVDVCVKRTKMPLAFKKKKKNCMFEKPNISFSFSMETVFGLSSANMNKRN